MRDASFSLDKNFNIPTVKIYIIISTCIHLSVAENYRNKNLMILFRKVNEFQNLFYIQKVK